MEVDTTDMWVENPPAEITKPTQQDQQIARLLAEVPAYIARRPARTFFSNSITRNLSRHLGYESWCIGVKVKFDETFLTLLSDPVFLNTQIRAAYNTQCGYGISVEKIATLIITCAGYMAYSMAVAENFG